MHAAAITLLAGAASGFALAMSIPDDKTPLIKSLQVRFLKKAEGDLAAVATLPSEAMSRVSSEDRGELIVPVKVTDASGNEPVACEALWAGCREPTGASTNNLHTTVLALSLRDNLCVWGLGVLGDDAAEGTMQTLTASLYLIIIPEWQQFDPELRVTATFPILINMGVAQCAA
jgi:Domain of unknown function (DUF4442)